MSKILNTSFCDPITNCFGKVKQRVGAVHQTIRESCSTDNKMYAFLIVGRVLQAAAILSFAGAVASAITAGYPMLVAGLIVSLALGALGTWCTGDLHAKVESFVIGQPVGLRNKGNNCWLNASLQMLANIPAFEQRMLQIPQLAQFLDSYRAARSGHRKVAADIDSNQIRQVLHRALPQEISQEHIQQDAATTFEYLFSDSNALYQFESFLNGAVSTAESRSMLQIGLARGEPIPSFLDLLSGSFEATLEDGRRQQFFFPQAPNDLLIHFKRFYFQGTSGEHSRGKITDPIETPERFQFPSRFVRSGENATYQCDAFVQHTGSSLDGGHYISYIKVGSTWWCCDDTVVYEITSDAAHTAMKQSYIMHYAKIEPV